VAQYNAVSGAEDYFQTVVINSLLVILKDQTLSSHHHTVIEAVMSIFKTQGLKCVTFLPQVGLRAICISIPDTHLFLDYTGIHDSHSYVGG
jgi:phosphatidylinositol kinase/protein kinase (PI-3  family)